MDNGEAEVLVGVMVSSKTLKQVQLIQVKA
jgi:hypothetical protein